ncbi:Thioredoxin reductase [compost metagenome]
MEHVIVIGAGPCGLSAAVELQRAGLTPLLIEKNCLVHSIYLYPTNLQFFSTAELLEIGGIPFTTTQEKPSRNEALVYYRNVAIREKLRIHAYEEVVEVLNDGQSFQVTTNDRYNRPTTYHARNVVVATGYFDHPNLLGIPGEELSKVTHYYKEAHPYTGAKVTVIGGSNSAIDAAMDLYRVGAEVTIVYRGSSYSSTIKPWVRPVFESLVNKGRINMLFNSQVQQITEDHVCLITDGAEATIENDFVLALTGFRPDRSLLSSLGIAIQEETGTPYHNPATMETNVTGFYLAGVVASSKYDANEIFIETGRLHGVAIARHIAAQLRN